MSYLGLIGDRGVYCCSLHVEFRVGCLEFTAADLYPAFFAVDHDTLLFAIIRLLGHDGAVVIFVGQAVIPGISGRNDLYRTAAVLTEGPLCDIEHMCTPVCHKTAAGNLVPAPCAPEFLLLGVGDDRIQVGVVIDAFGERSEPLVPVESCGNGHMRKLARSRSCGDRIHIVPSDIDFDLADLSECAFAGEGSGVDELVAGTLLAADMEDTAIFADGLDYLLSLIDRKGQGFLKINILSGLAGGDSDDCMLMVGNGDDYCIDVRAGQEVLIVFVNGNDDFLFTLLGVIVGDFVNEAVALDVINIATGDNADVIH